MSQSPPALSTAGPAQPPCKAGCSTACPLPAVPLCLQWSSVRSDLSTLRDHLSVFPCLFVLSSLRNTACFFLLKAIASKRTKAFRKASTKCRTCGRQGGCLVSRWETSARKFHQIHETCRPGQALFLKSPIISGTSSLFDDNRLRFPLDSQNLKGSSDNRWATGWP